MAYVKVHLKEIIKYVLLLGLGIQVVLGLSGGLLWLSRSGNWLQCVKAVVNLLICGGAGYIFLGEREKKLSRRVRVLATLGILASPNVLQGCMQEPKKTVAFLLPVIVVFACFLWRKIRKKSRIILLMVACVATIVSCNVGMSEYALAPSVLSRISFPSMLEGVGKIPGELLEEVGYVELREALRSPEGIQDSFYPALLERYGSKDKADALCYELACYGLGFSTKKVIGNIVWDLVGYHFPILVSEMQLKGMAYDALTGANYCRLQENLGGFSELYWEYSVLWNLLGTLIIILYRAVKRYKLSGQWRLGLGVLGLGALCYTLRGAGIFDYTKLLLVQFLWMGCLTDCISEKG